MSLPRNWLIWILIPILVLLSQEQTWGETDRGTAAVMPWSGSWWPHKSGGLTGPL